MFLIGTSNLSQASNNIELNCRLESGVELRYTIDIEGRKMFLFSKIEVDIKVSDSEIVHENIINGIIMNKIVIDRYTLNYRAYSPLKLNGKEWNNGSCEIIKKKI